jgi:hypothetical protein
MKMALRAVPDHPKFAHLKALLGLGKGATLGYLEAVWHFTGRFTPQGDIGKYSDSQIENWVEWPGEAGELIAAMVEAKWIDRDDVHRLLVHDWHQHADKATKNALGRAEKKFCAPTVRTESIPGTDPVRTPDIKLGNMSRLPEPVPVPVPGPSTLSAANSAAACDLAAETFDLSDEERREAWSRFGTPKKSLLTPEVETVLEYVSVRIHARHPVIRRCGITVVKKQLRTIMRGTSPAQQAEQLNQIDQNHAGWCAWPEWRKDDGQYAKGLEKWLAPTMGRWSEPPPSAAGAGGIDPEPPKLMM